MGTIRLLDEMLGHLFTSAMDDVRVDYEPPDDLWRGQLGNENVLSIYLVDLRENRMRRSNERERKVENGTVTEVPGPARVDCHYLVTAWSPARVTESVAPTLDEHDLLEGALAVLLEHAPFNPSKAYRDDQDALNRWPEPFRDGDLPTQVLPAEGFPRLADFWGAMGSVGRWKPAIYLIVTVPVLPHKEAQAFYPVDKDKISVETVLWDEPFDPLNSGDAAASAEPLAAKD
jgi:hypothetical protein